MNRGVEYFDEINILRAFAILAVISMHISINFEKMSYLNFLAISYMAILVLSHFAVALFVCISGFVLYNKYSSNFPLKKFYKTRFMSVLPPYIIFSTFYLIVTYVGSIVLSKYIIIDIPHIVLKYLTGQSFYHLWFLIVIIQLYLLYPILSKISDYFNSRGRSFGLLFGAYIMGIIYSVNSPPDGSTLQAVTLFICYIFYFLLGMMVRSRYEELLLLRKSVSNTSLYCMSVPLLYCIILGIFFFTQIYFNFKITRFFPIVGQYWYWLSTITNSLCYLIIFVFCWSISLDIISHKNVIFRVLEKIGRYSFGIYLIHAFILYAIILEFSWFGFDWNNWLFYPLTFCLTLILSIGSVDVIKKFPFSDYIIGRTR
jgi:probable poly-beta-1,6-N-acetyl-D-glucosamine export protein